MQRLDKRGRRIGRNWWREMICELLLDATIVWDRQCEEATSMYDTEVREYKMRNPMPQLKVYLLAHKGQFTTPPA